MAKKISVLIKQKADYCVFNSDESWTILSPIEQSIKAKIEKVGTPLKDWDINIYRGVLTGYNDAFIINGDKKNEILQNCKSENERNKTAEIIRPILRGRDIKRYSYDFANLYLIFIPWHFPLHNSKKIEGASKEAEQEFENQYPAIYNYLLTHKKRLSNRNKAETGVRYEWYALQRWGANYWEDFSKQKIVWNRIASKKLFALVDENIYIQDSMHFFTGNHLKYLLAILNSKLFNCLMFMTVGVAAGGNAGNAANVKDLKVLIPNKDLEKHFEFLLEGESIQEIDNLIYQLYNLNKKEIEFIENLYV